MRRVRLIAAAAITLTGLAGASVVAAIPAFAVACANGSTCAPAPLTVGPGATLVASTSGTVTASGSFSADYMEAVFSDPTNEYCNGCLDWVLQVTNRGNSADTLQRLNISNFAGFIVDIGVNTNGVAGFPNAGTAAPAAVARNTTGKVVTWDFSGTHELQPGQTTLRLEAETNATEFQRGLISFQDGGAQQTAGFEPAAPKPGIPETPWVPAGLLAGSVAGGFTLMRRERNSRSGIVPTTRTSPSE